MVFRRKGIVHILHDPLSSSNIVFLCSCIVNLFFSITSKDIRHHWFIPCYFNCVLHFSLMYLNWVQLAVVWVIVFSVIVHCRLLSTDIFVHRMDTNFGLFSLQQQLHHGAGSSTMEWHTDPLGWGWVSTLATQCYKTLNSSTLVESSQTFFSPSYYIPVNEK